MPASQTRSVSYRIGEAASGGMGAISQPANQSESGPGPFTTGVPSSHFRNAPQTGREFKPSVSTLCAISVIGGPLFRIDENLR